MELKNIPTQFNYGKDYTDLLNLLPKTLDCITIYPQEKVMKVSVRHSVLVELKDTEWLVKIEGTYVTLTDEYVKTITQDPQ